MIKSKMTLRVSEADLIRDVRGVLEKVAQGSEVIVEREDHRPIAVIRAPARSGRPADEILREARERNVAATLDEGFSSDLEAVIETHQKPWNPPSWD